MQAPPARLPSPPPGSHSKPSLWDPCDPWEGLSRPDPATVQLAEAALREEAMLDHLADRRSLAAYSSKFARRELEFRKD